MIVLIVLLLVIWVAVIVAGILVKGLAWLVIVGAALIVVTLVFGAAKSKSG